MADEEKDLTAIGSFVWAKVTGHPFWPGQVVESGPGIKARSGYVVVRFYASNDFASVKPTNDQLKAYKPGTVQTPGKKNRKLLNKAIRHIERAMKGEKNTTDDGPAAGKAQNMDSGSSSSRIRPSIVPADSTSLATILPQASGIPATTAKLGFLGLGIMGGAMAMNLLRTGHDVSVWNRTASKTIPLRNRGATVYDTKRQIVENCDIIFACVSDPKAAREIVFGNGGVLKYMNDQKAYVDMSTVDPETAIAIGEAIRSKGGRFLEAPVSGSKVPAELGELIIMCAGDRTLYVDLYSCMEAISKKWFFLSEVGSAARMKLVVNSIMGAQMAALAEGMALAEKCDLDQVTLLEILSLGALGSKMVNAKGSAILESNFPPNFPLRLQQKDLRLAVSLSDKVHQPISVIASANELYKRSMAANLGDSDMSAVYEVVHQRQDSSMHE
ncbi:Oidioi.mRNA.OKI2018_I69.chr1.g2541.t1.cds [Oikopleura dioica]|uniref:Cytokine-like nuclear factor N-PAC n=1 Tax=Oikopleura dioica TaxID=34765 RepID=A0ABN7SVM6_OIKDI|nr:Oidioi.mRNA.OKI2018_I69.chr1.g2541.t1.cds [Oikopleura dioica]